MADPETSASAVANKATFLITIPASRASKLAGAVIEKVFECTEKLLFGNLYRRDVTWKRKSQSDDDFLGVLAISGNLVDVCDIPTTTVMPAGMAGSTSGTKASGCSGLSRISETRTGKGSTSHAKRAAAIVPRPF